MGRAVDTVLAFSTQAGAGAFPVALAAAAGDSLQVRGTKKDTQARLLSMITGSNAAGQKFRLISPLLHDNVTGLTFLPPDNPGLELIPAYEAVELNELDNLTVQGACGAATTITAGLVIAYDDIRGAAAELYTWADLRSDIKYIKAVEVSNSAIAVGAWTDTVLTNTEDQMHADKSYAILGYECSAAVDIVGVKGVATGNLRYCGPGSAQSFPTSEYYIWQSERHNLPLIPVMQANDRKAFYISQANHAAVAGGSGEVIVIVAELKTKR